MREDDVKVITDLMMGGEGNNVAGELTDLHLSAISEAMNQMVGSSATSMSAMFDKRIDISPPKAFIINFASPPPFDDFNDKQQIVKVSFRMVVGNLIDSEIMQLLPIDFAKDLVSNLLNIDIGDANVDISQVEPASSNQKEYVDSAVPPKQDNYKDQQAAQPQQQRQGYQTSKDDIGYMLHEQQKTREPVNVQPAMFQSFDEGRIASEKKNISLIMDVPLQVTVELGRTHRLIKDVLEFGPGSIIELDKLSGEPVDILVNGKPIAKGEVVVIDESFGVRITDIIHPAKRL